MDNVIQNSLFSNRGDLVMLCLEIKISIHFTVKKSHKWVGRWWCTRGTGLEWKRLQLILSSRNLLWSRLLSESGENVELDLDLVELLGSQGTLLENRSQPVAEQR